MATNKVVYGNETIMDITDTSATPDGVVEGQVFYAANGTRSTGTLTDATTTTHGLMSAVDKIKLDEAYIKPTDGIPAADIADGVIPDISGKANSEDLAIVATSGSYTDLLNRPTVIKGTGSNAVVIGQTTASKASNTSAVAEGSSTASGQRSHAEGWATTASATGAHSEGYFARATGSYSHAENGLTTLATIYLTGEANATTYTYDTSYSFTDIDINTIESKTLNYNNTIYYISAIDTTNHTITVTSTLNKTAALSNASVKYSGFALAKGQLSHAEQSANAFGLGSHAEGETTYAKGLYSHSEGRRTEALGSYSHAEGRFTMAVGVDSHAEGYGCNAQGRSSHAEGEQSQAIGENSHAENGMVVLGTILISGPENSTTYTYKIKTIPPHTVNNQYENYVLELNSNYMHISSLDVTDKTIVVESTLNPSEVFTDTEVNLCVFSAAMGDYSHAEGNSYARGKLSHAEGDRNYAFGEASHVEGLGCETNGDYAHAEGVNTKANETCAHAEGDSTSAEGWNAHAEGEGTIASGEGAHSEGFYTVASGDFSHASGVKGLSSGTASFSHGSNIITNANNMTAFGASNVQSNLYPEWEAGASYAIGDRVTNSAPSMEINDGYECIVANNDSTWIASNWKALPSNGDTLFAIGNGTSSSNRSNAMSIDQSGNERLLGDLYVNTDADGNNGVKIDSQIFTDPFAFFSTQSMLSNAGFHNSIYRGKNLGTSVTNDQWNEISSGTFKDMYIGDYWTIDNTKYVICHFDYYINCGNTNFTKHHILVMPSGNMNLSGYYDLTARAISSAVTIGTTNYGSESAAGYRWNAQYTASGEEGADGNWANYTGLYINSHIYKDVLPAAENKIIAAIGTTHLLRCHKLLPSSCNASCVPTGWAWTTDTAPRVDLCNELQVYGQHVWANNIGYDTGIDKWQLAIFKLNPAFTNLRAHWWLRSVFSAASACYVNSNGAASQAGSAQAAGVRPLAIWG